MRLTLCSRGSFLGLFVLPLLGCNAGSERFDVAIVPAGQGVERSLRYESEVIEAEEPSADAASAPPAEAVRLATLFHAAVPAPVEGAYHFKSTFDAAMPDDVGGAGRWTRKQTSLGALCIYNERFRGSYDLAEKLEEQLETAETLSTLLSDWVRDAGTASPLRDRLEHVVREELPRDLKDFLVLSLFEAPAEHEDDAADLWMHAAQHFSERGYLDVDLLLQAMWHLHSGVDQLRIARSIIAHKLQLENDQQILATWPALATPELLEASLNKVVEATETYREFIEPMKEVDGEAPLPAGVDLLGSFAWTFIGRGWTPSDSLSVALQCPQKPLKTNGEWREEEMQLRWEASVPKRGVFPLEPPQLCYAIWTEPDENFQREHFGKVVLKGEALGSYCSWRFSLDVPEGEQWDRFLNASKPGDDLAYLIGEFAFSGPREGWSSAAREIDQIQRSFVTD